MAVQLLAGLARAGAGAGRVASAGAKKLAISKAKSVGKDKVKSKAKGKLLKKSEIISSEGDQQQQKLKYSSMSGGLTPTLTGTTNPVKIESAPSSKSQIEKLKINVTNIHSFLVKSNKQYKKQEANTKRNERVQQSKAKLRGEERRLEKGSSPLAKSASIIKDISSPVGSLFDRIMDFVGTLVLGIAVNALPTIIEKVKEIIDNIVNFLTPIQSGFNVLMSFFNKDMDQDQLDVDKKRFDDGIQNITGKDGLLDKIKEKLGPFGGLVDILRPAIEKIRESLGLKKASQKIKLEKRGDNEGFVNVETGEFTQRQWTSAERKTSGTSGAGSGVKTDTGDGDDSKGTGKKDRAHGAGGGGSTSKVGFVPGKGNKEKGIFLHWSAGSHTTAYNAYHSIALGDGTMVRHTPYDQDKYSHTGGANTNSVGLAIAAAAGAISNGKLGQYAPTDAQLDAMTLEAAKLAVKWGWTEATIDKNVRTHGEWERYAVSAGILTPPVQRWDLDRLKDGDPLIDTSKVLSYGGNQLRQMIKQHFRKLKKYNVAPPTKAKITPKVNITGAPQLTAILNQPVNNDNDGSTTIAVQQVNNTQTSYVPMPIPRTSTLPNPIAPLTLSSIWGLD
jgi:hypothetical protein